MKSDFGDEYLPKRATKGSAGYDFFSPVKMDCGPVNVGIAGYNIIDTGIHLEEGDLKEDEVMLIFPRSSYGFKYGFHLANTVGVIDSDYRDSIKVAFAIDHNLLNIRKGDRIAQGVIVKFGKLPNEIAPTDERTGGVGSTGV